MPKARATTMAATIHDDATVLASANTNSVKVPKLNLDNIRTEPEQTRADGETRPRSGLTSVSSSFFHRPNAAAVAEVTANTLDKSSEKTNETSTLRLSKK
jgi:hypothetical protein